MAQIQPSGNVQIEIVPLVGSMWVGWRDENATTDPVASIDGAPLGSIHTSSLSPLIRLMAPVVQVEHEDIPQQVEILRIHEIVRLRLKCHESAVWR